MNGFAKSIDSTSTAIALSQSAIRFCSDFVTGQQRTRLLAKNTVEYGCSFNHHGQRRNNEKEASFLQIFDETKVKTNEIRYPYIITMTPSSIIHDTIVLLSTELFSWYYHAAINHPTSNWKQSINSNSSIPLLLFSKPYFYAFGGPQPELLIFFQYIHVP